MSHGKSAGSSGILSKMMKASAEVGSRLADRFMQRCDTNKEYWWRSILILGKGNPLNYSVTE